MVETLESLKLSESTCVLCGELLYDAKELLLKETEEKKGRIYTNRRYALPRDYHAYCINRPCGNFRDNIPFGRLLFIKEMADLKKEVAEIKNENAELKANQQKILGILLKKGEKNESYEIEEVKEYKKIELN